MNNYKKLLKRDISIKESKLNRLNKKQEQKIEILKRLDAEEQEQDYFEIIGQLESIQEQMETTNFELNEAKDELGELE